MALKHFAIFQIVSFSLIVATLFSCNDHENVAANLGKPDKRKVVVRDSSFAEYIVAAEKAMREEVQSKVGIKPIEEGFEGLQIRIYNFSAFGNDDRMVVLTNSNSKWSARLVSFATTFNGMGDSVSVSIKSDVKRDQPHSSWDKLLDSLTRLDIYTLPDSDSLKNYNVPTDGGAIDIEYIKAKDFRSYSYSAPRDNYKQIAEARKVVHILNLIENEFDFKGFGFELEL
jgi:hypothetical protein